jgi:hypothetical protein
MVPFDSQKVLRSARQATTEDLLDRVTAYRDGMEGEALEILEAELRRRGVGREQIEAHARQAGPVLRGPDGVAVKCNFCRRPAVARGWGWHRLWGKVPVFPRRFYYCPDHQPKA